MHHVILILLQEEDVDEEKVQYNTEGERGRISMGHTEQSQTAKPLLGNNVWFAFVELKTHTHMMDKDTSW